MACGHNRAPKEAIKSGFDGTPSRLRGRSFREICEGFAAKPFRTLSHALTRMIGELFLTGNAGGKGAKPPKRA